jgi:hypothetical protein
MDQMESDDDKIGPITDEERLDLSRYPEDLLSSDWCRLMNRQENVG